MIKVSIIMPCYNDGRYLEESINSARAQTYPDTEIILVDDGSDDPLTQKIVQKMERTSDVRVLHGHHRGPAAARNLGIEHAQGAYILPLDADDLIEPEYIAKAVPILETSPHIGIVYCKTDFFDAGKGLWEMGEFSLSQMLWQNMISNTALFRKEDWKRAGGYCEECWSLEDWDFWLSLLELELVPFRINKVMYHYRLRQEKNSLSDKRSSIKKWKDLYHDILVRHILLYQKEIVAYNDAIRERIIQMEAAGSFQLSPSNRWILMAKQIPWKLLEKHFAERFSRLRERFPSPVRVALGIHIIQTETGLSDELLLLEIQENPYMQFFCYIVGSNGIGTLSMEDLNYVHEQMTEDMLEKISRLIKG